jgi:hypothetical protein
LLDLKDGQNRLEGKIYTLEDDITDIKNDVAEIKTTMNALSAGLLDTSKEVNKIKGNK